MRYSRDNAGFDRIATLDIETTHYKPAQGETVSVGVGVHDRDTPASEASYKLFHRDEYGEATLIERAFQQLSAFEPDALVSYKGRDFDLDFLTERLSILNASAVQPEQDSPEPHIDLFEDRKAEADRRGDKWPNLEECLDAYGWTPATTTWDGGEVTNVRFGEELGPAYLQALEAGDDDRRDKLTNVIEHYLVTDLEANLAVYYGDIGESFEPTYLGTEEAF